MHTQGLIASYNPPLRVCDGAFFDGTNDWLSRAGTLSGAADSKSGIASFWYRSGSDAATNRTIFSSDIGGPKLGLNRTSGGLMSISGRNAAGTLILSGTSTNTVLIAGGWKHILFSWDLAAAALSCYFSDVAETLTSVTTTNDTLNYAEATGNTGVGAASTGAGKCFCDLADVYIAYGKFLDLSLVANRRKFISASGKPVHLGTDGSLPTGTAPIVYTHIDDGEAVANFGTNRGTGGNFTVNGTLTTSSSSPSD